MKAMQFRQDCLASAGAAYRTFDVATLTLQVLWLVPCCRPDDRFPSLFFIMWTALAGMYVQTGMILEY